MKVKEKAESDWEMVEAQLPADWREVADEMGLVQAQPSQLNAKVRDIRDVLRLVLHHAGAGASLRATTARAAATGVLVLSAVALHKWMKKLGPYLAALLQRMMGTAAFAPERWAGFHLIAADATTVQRPGAKGTTTRIHYALRLADLSPRHVEVTDEKGGETARRFRAEPGELWLLDRGYASPPGIASIDRHGAHLIVRYNRGTLPLYDALGRRIDVEQLLRSMPTREVAHSYTAFVHGPAGELIEGRLCWLRLPEDKAREARARTRARREAEGDCDAATLENAEYVSVFTTTDAARLTAEQVLTLYRARWQVELDFKRSKSIDDLDTLPNFLPETIHSWICAKLLLQQIARTIASPRAAFPPGGVRFSLLPAVAASATSPRPRGRRALVRQPPGLERHLSSTAPRGVA
jgi:hypothetical protein